MKKSFKTQKLWTSEELYSLAKYRKDGLTHSEIAKKLGRTRYSVANAIVKIKHGKIVQSNITAKTVKAEKPVTKSFKVSVTARLKSISFAEGQLTFEIES